MLRHMLRLSLFALSLLTMPALAQTAMPTVPQSAKITTGLTYQQILPADNTRKALTVQNNMTSADTCLIIFSTPSLVTAGVTTTASTVTINGITMTAAQASVLLQPGGSYTRYWPHLPQDALFGTCTSTGDSLYVDVQ